MHRLQCLGHDDVVEGIVVEVGEPGIQVGLDDVDAGLHAKRHVVVIYFETVSRDLQRFPQVFQQGAVAAAEIQYAAARGDHFADAAEVVAQAHDVTPSSATFCM